MKQRVLEIRFNSNVSPFSPDLRQQHLPSFHVPASPPTLAVTRKPWLFSLEHLAPAKLPPHHAIDASRYPFADTPTATGKRPRLTQAIATPLDGAASSISPPGFRRGHCVKKSATCNSGSGLGHMLPSYASSAHREKMNRHGYGAGANGQHSSGRNNFSIATDKYDKYVLCCSSRG